ncbi:MAG: hypothetical protein AB8H86_12375 [Polyangiales bacterium]
MGRGVQSALIAVALMGCSVFDPGLVEELERDAGRDAFVADAGPADTSTADVFDASGEDAGTVVFPTAPLRPPAGTEGPDVEERLYALRDALLNQDGDQWRTIGFDLDGRHTEAPEYDIECRPPDEESEPEVDGANGIDNAFSHRLFPLLQLALPGLERSVRESQAAGIGALLLRVTGFNGTEDDPRVDVSFMQSAGGTGSDEAVSFTDFDLLNEAGGAAPVPSWDGEDRWWARDDGFFSGDEAQPLIRDDNAYVSDGRLVMRLPERAQFLFITGTEVGARVRLTDSTVMVDLREGESFGHVVMAGRWSILDLLDTGENIGICMGSTQREIVDSQLLVIADVRSTAGSGGEGVECDAISIGVTFQAVPGTWVGLGPSVPLPNPCAAGAE